MACQCGCNDAPNPDTESRPVAEGERRERELDQLVKELESRVEKLETERAAA